MPIRRSSTRLATVFGLGFMRPASGTWGSLPPAIVAAALLATGWGPSQCPAIFFGVQGLLLVVFAAACIAQGDAAEARWGKDPSRVVADEVAGQAVTLLLAPWAVVLDPPVWAAEAPMTLALFTVALSFVAFRLMDIVKPWPAQQIQSLPAGWGVLLDDLVAGVYAAILVQVAARIALR